MIKNDRLLKALAREPVDCTPIWIMRQAGRYLPEYRATRQQAGSFMDLCRNTDLACEVTLQPLRRFDLDAAILFSDILTIPDAMGLGLYFETGKGPKFRKPVRTEKDIANLPKLNVETDLDYVMNAVSAIRSALGGSVPLIGFSGSPFTLATYMIEGQSSRQFKLTKQMLYGQPELAHALLTKLADSVAEYLNAQIRAGAQVIQIFDSWGGALSDAAYREFSLAYMQRVVNKLQRESEGRKVPVILFTKGGGNWLEAMADTGADALSVDWTVNLGNARQRVGDRVALQGNMDPAILLTTPDAIETEVKRLINDFGTFPGHVFNLGHGVTPDIDPDNVRALVDAVHKHSQP